MSQPNSPVTIQFFPLSSGERASIMEDAQKAGQTVDPADFFMMQSPAVGPSSVAVDPSGNIILTAQFVIPKGLFVFQKTSALLTANGQPALDLSAGLASPPIGRIVCRRSGLSPEFRDAPAIVQACDTTPAVDLMPGLSRLRLPPIEPTG